MFTKLRNKFLILNLAITSIVVIAAFAIIYFITYTNTNLEIQSRLNSRLETQMIVEEGGKPYSRPEEVGTSTSNAVSSSDPLLFNIEVDDQGRIININSFFDMSEEAYHKAAEIAWQNKNSNSIITLEGKQWRYGINPVSVRIISKDGKQITSTENSYSIVFLDVTASMKTLFQLLSTLIIVGLITLGVIFIVSLYFSNRAIKPIAAAWEKQKRFVADASHELKTPLSIINANYDALLANQEETIKSQMKWLDYMRIGTDRMAKLINDLLTLARIEGTNLESQKTSFDIGSAVSDVISSMEAVIVEKGIKLSHSIEADINIKSDLERIKQVATILLDNAIKYTNKNGLIDVSLVKSKRQIICSITNSGKGIPKQDLPKVFDRFYRADPSRTHEGGYGLGLSIAKTIIDSLGGQIYVKSVEGEFTTFTFTLTL